MVGQIEAGAVAHRRGRGYETLRRPTLNVCPTRKKEKCRQKKISEENNG